MENRRQYDNHSLRNDLQQYEMGLELGADIEENKTMYKKEYNKSLRNENCCIKGHRKNKSKHQD